MSPDRWSVPSDGDVGWNIATNREPAGRSGDTFTLRMQTGSRQHAQCVEECSTATACGGDRYNV
jgi:hypothetical protein